MKPWRKLAWIVGPLLLVLLLAQLAPSRFAGTETRYNVADAGLEVRTYVVGILCAGSDEAV